MLKKEPLKCLGILILRDTDFTNFCKVKLQKVIDVLNFRFPLLHRQLIHSFITFFAPFGPLESIRTT